MKSYTRYIYISEKDGLAKEVYSPDNPPPVTDTSGLNMTQYLRKYGGYQSDNTPLEHCASIGYHNTDTLDLFSSVDDGGRSNIKLMPESISIRSYSSYDSPETTETEAGISVNYDGAITVNADRTIDLFAPTINLTGKLYKRNKSITDAYYTIPGFDYASELTGEDYGDTDSNYTRILISLGGSSDSGYKIAEVAEVCSSSTPLVNNILKLFNDKGITAGTYTAVGVLDLGVDGALFLNGIRLEDGKIVFEGFRLYG